ncbi:hypothetical protein CBS147333_3279 [Penicillium roqueforti]|nr:hypothetical protein CBS147354_9005 [Penicillium roqueforti]KAI3112771.1 hypothetical protein CBS147333_3279 [Penicillium roqueforti]KAI3129727.1 hypothetical protein CBS147326_6176 [Penicillium roqueforti]KAI3195004.1 hypothetical protein CBS147311_8314 [Penicillium roqueforti]KAI3269761.1 hypothetical protein CBS147308_5274 [Penicillium roqueforti]
MDPAETNSICDLEGTEITTEAKIDPPLPSVTWVITEKLKETSFFRYQEDANEDLGYPYAAAKFLCYPKDDPAKTPAFLRIYQQIPITGTENSRSRIRIQQAITQSTNELDILKELMQMDCTVVPKLLGYQEAQQESDDIIPSGFITYVIWEKVPGVPLSKLYIWRQTPEVRDAMRKEFRRVYQELVSCGIQPIPPHESKLSMISRPERCT